MEREAPPKETRYIYNPFLLNCAYQKIEYAHRVRQLYAWRTRGGGGGGGGHKMEPDERYRLIKENFYAEQVVADLFHLVNAMRAEKFPYDVYHCNYEYALHRLYCLLWPVDAPFPPLSHSLSAEERLPIEHKCIEVLQAHQHRERDDVMLRALDRYVARYYIIGLVNYDGEAVKRNSLLFNIKHRIEDEVRGRQRNDPDYAIEYNREVALSMLYVLLADELLALAKEEATQLRVAYQTYRKPRSDDEYVQCQRETQRCEAAVALLTELDTQLRAQFHDEFFGFSFALITAFPDAGAATAALPATAVMQRYVMQAPGRQMTVSRVKDLASGDFVVQEKHCSHIRYISLRKNRKQYVHATRRMIFDHLLLQSHHHHIDESGGNNYTRCCQVCNYLQQPDSLSDFYVASLAHTYYTCEYVVRGGDRTPTQEELLLRFLSRQIIDPLSPLTSLIYKNAAQAMLLFCDATPHPGLSLFHVINTQHALRYIADHYTSHDGGCDARQYLILLQSKRPGGNVFNRVEKWQKKLARDIDIYMMLMLAVNVQSNEIEKYERASTGGGGGAAYELNLTKTLFDVYAVYMNVLDDTTKKIY